MIAPVEAVNSHNKCVDCSRISITGLKLNVVTETIPIKVGFIGFFKDPTSRVRYTVTNLINGTQICNFVSQTPEIYDVTMSAYSPHKFV